MIKWFKTEKKITSRTIPQVYINKLLKFICMHSFIIRELYLYKDECKRDKLVRLMCKCYNNGIWESPL